MNPKIGKIWEDRCPELVKLAKRLSNATNEPAKRAAKSANDAAVILNRWGRTDAHTAKWMVDQVIARIRIDEELARTPTQDFSRPDATTLAVRKQAQDDDFVLDQSFSSGETDRLLREQDRKLIAKSHDEAGVSLRSEYGFRNHNGGPDGPLDMGFMTISELGSRDK